MTDNTADSSQYLTVEEVATDLRLSKMSVYRMIHAGEIIAIRLNRRSYRVLRDSYQEYKRQLHADAIARAESAGPPGPIPGQMAIAPPVLSGVTITAEHAPF